jgi:hypothetical protein
MKAGSIKIFVTFRNVGIQVINLILKRGKGCNPLKKLPAGASCVLGANFIEEQLIMKPFFGNYEIVIFLLA